MTTRYPFTLIKEKIEARGETVLDFAVGKRHISRPPEIDSWVHSHGELATQPATRPETDEFAQAAAAFLAREYGADIASENVLPTPGGRAAMSAIVACMLDPGDVVLVTEPGYPAFARLARHRHARVHEVSLDGNREFLPDFRAALAADEASPRVIALNYPNNPTGVTLTSQTVDSIRDVAGAGTIVFNDATYGPLVYGQQPVSLLNDGKVAELPMELLELHSFSKLFPLGPVAISFLVGSRASIEMISNYSEFAWSPVSRLQLRATTMCLKDAKRIRELREFFPAQLQNLRRVLGNVGFRPFPASAGVYMLCRAPSRIAGKAVDSAGKAAARLMDEFDLAVVPWDTAQDSYLRFSSLYMPEDLERLSSMRERLQLA